MAYQTLLYKDFPPVNGAQEKFDTLINNLPPLDRKGPWIAGGSVRKFMNGMQNKADYDIFFASNEQMNHWMAALVTRGAVKVSSNIFNSSYEYMGYKVQCIHHEFRNTLIQTMDRFDISICQFGFDGTHLVWSDQAGEDCKAMTLHFLQTTDPIYNFNRAFKYASEGYKPADGEVAKVLRRIATGKATLKNNRSISPAWEEAKAKAKAEWKAEQSDNSRPSAADIQRYQSTIYGSPIDVTSYKDPVRTYV